MLLLPLFLLQLSPSGSSASRVARANLHPPNDETGVLLKPARMPDPAYHPDQLEEWLEDCDFIDSMTLNKPAVPATLQTKPYGKLNDGAVASFRERGFVTLRKVLSARELSHRVRLHSHDIGAKKDRTIPLSKALPVCCKAIFDSRAIYGESKAGDFESFFRLHNLWRNSRFIRQLVFAPRFASIAADLMGVSAVKLYQDSLFVKQTGHNASRWHQDHVAAPFVQPKPASAAATNDGDNEGDDVGNDGGMQMVTMWLPLQKTTDDEMGALRFAVRSHHDRKIFLPDTPGDGNTIGTLSDAHVRSLFAVEEAAARLSKHRLQLGDASFHDGFTLHGSGPNLSSETRWALAVQFVAADVTAMTPSAFEQQRPESQHPRLSLGPRVGDDRYSFGEWLRAIAVFGDITEEYRVVPVEHPLLPLVWSRDLDPRTQYFKAQDLYEGFQVGTWRPSDFQRRCPLDESEWRNEYGDGCEPYKKGNPAHLYCISDGQEAYLHCASSCETMCRSSSFHKQVLESASEL